MTVSPSTVELPITVDLEVTYTEPGFKGDTATGGTKPATLETGTGGPGAALCRHRQQDSREDRHRHLC